MKPVKSHFILTLIFFINGISVNAQDNVYYNQSPSEKVINNPITGKNEVYYVLLESTSFSELHKVINFCDRNRKIAGYCNWLEPIWNKRQVIVVKDFLTEFFLT